ncbi:MAG: 1-deoxy-D-xylulose 5-phosphate reductoisomerase [Elusimicrobia bacterium ADurb.Bin231]|nr:MAG: 1-deoxy-D-xylulose 5-phosphate reductoisomerase [Elusimicrobia bacterium ADurb.Bin231]
MTKIAILGSTGSIGTTALRVISRLKDFQITALSANGNIPLLNRQALKFKPKKIAVGQKQIEDISLIQDADIVLIAVVGFAGLKPLINAIKLKKRIALANKESLIVAGDLINRMLKKYNAGIIPVDSEHSAIRQCLEGKNIREVSNIILTASGGALRKHTVKELQKVRVADVLNHPTWKMGKKITVDSATLINKGFEVIEAHYLFGIPYEKIKVVIHPQSLVHGAVEFIDGTIIAQMGITDMAIPIQYAITHPKKFPPITKKLDLASAGKIEFLRPDMRKFPCFALAMQAARESGSMPVVLNAANEVAVKKFLDGKINFMKIPRLIETVMKRHKTVKNPDMDDIFRLDAETRRYAEEIN